MLVNTLLRSLGVSSRLNAEKLKRLAVLKPMKSAGKFGPLGKLCPLGVVMLQKSSGQRESLKMKRPFGVAELAKVRPVPGTGKRDCNVLSEPIASLLV